MSFKVLLFVVTAVAYIAANSDARVIGINKARALDKICSIECKRLDCKDYTPRLDIVGCDCYKCSLPWPVQMKKNNHEDDNNHGPIRLDRDIEDDTSRSDEICSIECKRLGCKDYTPRLDVVGCDCYKCSLPVQMKKKNHKDNNNQGSIRLGRGTDDDTSGFGHDDDDNVDIDIDVDVDVDIDIDLDIDIDIDIDIDLALIVMSLLGFRRGR